RPTCWPRRAVPSMRTPPLAWTSGQSSRKPSSERISMIWKTCSVFVAARPATAITTIAVSQPAIQAAALRGEGWAAVMAAILADREPSARRCRNRRSGQREAEAAAARELALDFDASAMQREDALCDREAETAAAGTRARGTAAPVTVEDMRQLVGGDAGAGVANAHAHAVVLAIDRDPHRPAGRRVA